VAAKYRKSSKSSGREFVPQDGIRRENSKKKEREEFSLFLFSRGVGLWCSDSRPLDLREKGVARASEVALHLNGLSL
jgi:hypothetical protein